MKFSLQKLIGIFRRNQGRCYFCKMNLMFWDYGKLHGVGVWEVHHKIPKALKGSNKTKNLAPSCPSCNRSAQDNIVK